MNIPLPALPPLCPFQEISDEDLKAAMMELEGDGGDGDFNWGSDVRRRRDEEEESLEGEGIIGVADDDDEYTADDLEDIETLAAAEVCSHLGFPVSCGC